MAFLRELRERRLVKIVASYAAGGFILLEAIDQFAGRGLLPDVTYDIAFIWYGGGFFASIIIGWVHGEKGKQEASKGELSLLGVLAVVAIFLSRAAIVDALDRPAEGIEGQFALSSVAVLYFEDQDDDGKQQYLADALTEALIRRLSQVEALDVVSRNGAARFRDGNIANDSIAKLLKTGTLVRGTVLQEAGVIRVQVQLYDESGIRQSRVEVRAPEDQVLALRDEIAEEVAEHLRTWMGREIKLRRSREETESVPAWTLVQRAGKTLSDAQGLLGHGELSDALPLFGQADELLAQADGLDTSWGAPPALRARVWYERSRLETDPLHADEFMARALGYAEEAMNREPENADAHEVAGTVHYVRWLLGLAQGHEEAEQLLADAEKHLTEAVQLNPLQANAWNVLAHYYVQRDDILRANNAARSAYEADAYLAAAEDVLWRLYQTSYDLEARMQAVQACEEGRRRFPDSPRFYECGLWTMTIEGAEPDLEEVGFLAQAALERSPDHDREANELHYRTLVAAVLARASQSGGPQAALADSARALLDGARGNTRVDAAGDWLMTHAFVRTLLGDRDEAFQLLGRYLAANPERKDSFREHNHWWWRNLRRDPGWQQLVM